MKVTLPSEAQWGVRGARHGWPSAIRGAMSQQTRRGRCTGVRTGPQRWGAARQGEGPFGHLDLAGNVWQWCRDGFKSDEYRSRGGRSVDPVGQSGTTSGCCAVALEA
ncbi:MAG: SUMF1/EgtB/PvdO family nonheme iron enzyme [Nannocystis sp.]|nr:SUMF1/EgtB/PvdO family nonheme iron enzyme [Nannocystis sp.]